MSGWMPMMFTKRVRLYANTCRAISEARLVHDECRQPLRFLVDIQASGCRYTCKQAFLDDRVYAPIAIDNLRDAEINPDGHE
jgi:hypothetical protein